MSFINLISRSFFPQRWKKQLFQLFNQFFRKCILTWLCSDKKSTFLHQRNVKFEDYLRITSSPAGEGCVRDSVLILIDGFLWDFFFYFVFFYVELFALHGAFLIILNFSTGVRLCLGVILVGLLYSIGRFFFTGWPFLVSTRIKPETEIPFFSQIQEASWIPARLNFEELSGSPLKNQQFQSNLYQFQSIHFHRLFLSTWYPGMENEPVTMWLGYA